MPGRHRRPECEQCGSQDDTVRLRDCGYYDDLHGTSKPEVVCDACEAEHNYEL